MSDRERAEILLERVPDNRIVYLLCFMEGLTADQYEPNDDTIEAIEELESGGGEVFEGSTSDFMKMMLED